MVSTLINNRIELTIENKDEKIYFLSGHNNTITNIYDIKTSSWSTAADSITKRIRASSCIFNNKIYCIGGYGLNRFGNNDYSDDLDIYDIDTNTWTKGPYMIIGAGYLSCEVYNDKVYCIGGYGLMYGNSGHPTKIQIYDIKTNTWKLDLDMPNWKYRHSSIIKDNKIYCIGGNNLYTDILELPYISYDITLPTELQSKVDIIKNDGTGDKLLADNGTYIEYVPSGYRELDTEELNRLIDELKTV